MTLCVRHREGWCVSSKQKRLTKAEREGLVGVRTICGYHVIMHFGMADRTPTCKDCKAVQRARAPKPLERVLLGYRAKTVNKKGEVLQYTDPFPTRSAAVRYLKKNYDHFLSGGYAAIKTTKVMGWR